MNNMNDKTKERVGFGVVLLIVLCIAAVFFVRANGQDISVEITSRTEYIPGDEGQVIGEVRYVLSGEPATADCYASAYYPNKATLFFEQPMIETAFGTHYYNFSVPSEEGVYEYQTKCDIGDKNVTRSKAFHVSGLLRSLNERVQIVSEGVVEARLKETVANSWLFETTENISIGPPTCSIHLIGDLNTTQISGPQFDESFNDNITAFKSLELSNPICYGECIGDCTHDGYDVDILEDVNNFETGGGNISYGAYEYNATLYGGYSWSTDAPSSFSYSVNFDGVSGYASMEYLPWQRFARIIFLWCR